jgi:hypothetical protein
MDDVLTYPPRVAIESTKADLDLSAYVPADQNKLSSDARITAFFWIVELITIVLGGGS